MPTQQNPQGSGTEVKKSETSEDAQPPQASPKPHRAKNPPSNEPQIFAALDLGTNNCRLLIARRNMGVHRFGEVPSLRSLHATRPKPPFRIVESFSRIVRLGEGLGDHVEGEKRLNPIAVERTIEALKICAHKIKKARVDRIRCIATEACRRASDCDAFFERVKKETGLELEMISGVQEAELGLLSCAQLLHARKPYALIFDIGGGSTEVSYIRVKAGMRPESLATVSVPFGVVTLAERYDAASPFAEPNSGSLDQDAYAQIRAEMKSALVEAFEDQDLERQIKLNKVQMIGTSGTVTTLSSIVQKLDRYERSRVDGSYLTYKAVEQVCSQLLSMTNKERASIKSIGASRADLVMPGCAVLQGILDCFPVERLRVADRGLREGMLYELMNQSLKPRPAKMPVQPKQPSRKKRRKGRPTPPAGA